MEKEWGDMPECHKIKYILRGAHKNKTLNISQHILDMYIVHVYFLLSYFTLKPPNTPCIYKSAWYVTLMTLLCIFVLVA